MKYENAESQAFVSTLDGFTHLPFLSDTVSFKPGEEVEPHALPTILHEYTHHLHLRSPFGLALAYLNGATAFAVQLSKSEMDGYATPQTPQGYIDQEACHIFLGHYRNYIHNYYRLAVYYRWISEGLATYAELDFRPSATFNCASRLFSLVLSFVRRKVSETETFMNEGASMVNSCFAESTTSAKRSGTLYSLLATPSERSSCYFVGYLVLKSIQRQLSKLDPRLSDVELFYIFISGYVFNDMRLSRLVDETASPTFGDAVGTHLLNTLSDLLSASKPHLREAVDRIARYDEFPSDFLYLDYSAIVRGEGIRQFDESKEIIRLREQLLGLAMKEALENLKHGTEDQRVQRSRQVMEAGIDVFDILRINYSVFRIANRRRVVLGLRPGTEYSTLLTAGDAGTFWSLQYIETKKYDILRKQIDQESLGVSDLEGVDNVMQSIPELFEQAMNHQSPCFLNETDGIYANQRFHLLGRRDFMLIDNLTDHGSAVASEDVILSIAQYFDRTNYWDKVSVPIPADFTWNPMVPRDLVDKERELYAQVWRLVFPNATTTDSELTDFIHKKCQLIARSPAQLSLLRQLTTSTDSVPDGSDISATADTLNSRWKRYTGNEFIRSTDTNNLILEP